MCRRLSVLSTLVLAASSILAGCANDGTETDNPAAPDGIELLRSEAAYETDPQVSEADAGLLGEAQLAFSLDLYRAVSALAPESSNLMVAPYSGLEALVMAYAGARGETATEMAAMLHIGALAERVHPAMNGLSLDLAAAAGEGATLDINNSIWLALGLDPLAPFLDTLSSQYDTGVYRTDFAGDPEGSRRAINALVSEQTQGLIEELFEQGTIDSQTQLALTNTVYFAARWAEPFVLDSTDKAAFTLASGDTVEVDMMRGAEDLVGTVQADYSAVRLPYDGTTMSMVAVLPTEGTFDTFGASLDAARFGGVLDALDAGEVVAVGLPKFNFDTPIDLAPVLKNLGIVDAFGEDADFSGITGDQGLFVSEAVQKTSVAVDEAGTVAAGATGIAMDRLGLEQSVVFSRPFFFYIVDDATRTVLFAGRVMDPTAG